MNNEVLELTKEYRNTIFSVSLTKGRQPIEFSQWGAGEYKIDYDIKHKCGDNIILYVPFLTFATLEKALVFTRFCDKQKVKIQQTLIGYLSYGRQERETNNEPKLNDLLSYEVFRNLVIPSIIEPHDKECTKPHFGEMYWSAPYFHKTENYPFHVIAPDKGAKNRLSTLGIRSSIAISKERTNGEVVSVIEKDKVAWQIAKEDITPSEVDMGMIIYDDICDGGRTFANVAELVKKKYPNCPIYLYVAHAILPFGVESLKGN